MYKQAKSIIKEIKSIDNGIEGEFDGCLKYFADSIGNESVSILLSREIVANQKFRVFGFMRKGQIDRLINDICKHRIFKEI